MKSKLAAATAALLMTAGNAYAGPVTFSTPINVPNNIDGVYLNLLTGATGSSGSGVSGWDVNMYLTNSVFTFFWNNTAPSVSGGVAATANGAYLDLAPGTVVSSLSAFSATSGGGGAAGSAAFQTTGIHTLGFRFYNESTSSINYGYMRIQNTGPNGFPATILSWTFENSGGAITVPAAVAGVPEPATWALMILGFGAMGATMRRTRATTTRVRYAA
ncbi:MAG: PEPxxWA-CTERM sorting domain-containing protein [Sphingomonas sp.]|uniref:PEPxxWA-CTERM sorting domain-containing protein n=1 Tax=Sphingomonas sp. TaxID=28214 RepID=UPI001AC8106F|nr:PEPxxWA-CTERM sorting domain-containing protein [Sphingomonas sp.]MBN8814892.1 PEPxxWA-CTERM sorting domain-containing protein [Sphingomonas sp.]